MSGNGRELERPGTEPRDRGSIVRNKANFPALAGRGEGRQGHQHAGRSLRNKANFTNVVLEDKCFMEKGLGRIGCAKDLGKTKPISGRTERDKRRQDCGTTNGSNCAKQSQFASTAPQKTLAGRAATKRSQFRLRQTDPMNPESATVCRPRSSCRRDDPD